MRAIALCAALMAGTLAAAPQEPSSAPAASTAADPATLALAKEWFHRLQTGDIDHAQLNDNANMSLDDDSVKELSAQVAPLGAPLSFVPKQTGSLNGNAEYVYELTFKGGTRISFVLLLDGNGKIAGLAVQPG
jgi:hypothetical protein